MFLAVIRPPTSLLASGPCLNDLVRKVVVHVHQNLLIVFELGNQRPTLPPVSPQRFQRWFKDGYSQSDSLNISYIHGHSFAIRIPPDFALNLHYIFCLQIIRKGVRKHILIYQYPHL